MNLQAGIGRVRANFASQVKKGRLSEEAVAKLMKNLKGTLTYDNFRDIDMVSMILWSDKVLVYLFRFSPWSCFEGLQLLYLICTSAHGSLGQERLTSVDGCSLRLNARASGLSMGDNKQETTAELESVLQVIEAAVENVKIKQQIFADLEKACGPQTILSSNTSTIDISLIGRKTKAADRIVGAHFFSPAHIMPLLEIVRTSDTSKQVSLLQRTMTCQVQAASCSTVQGNI